MNAVRCDVCQHACLLAPGRVGACRVRANKGGVVVPAAYGRLTSIAVDPVEKKPLARWKPGSTVLSVGGYGCNLHCPWCQNASISQAGQDDVGWRTHAPQDLVDLARMAAQRYDRMVGIAYTYNEPLVCWEFVRDTSVLMHDAGFSNVLVSAGCVKAQVIAELAPLIDAANIDLKSFDKRTYDMVGGSLKTVCHTIEMLAATPTCHLEVTTLVVPGVNDTEREMHELAAWLASLDAGIVLHVSRFHPAWRKRDVGPTPVSKVYALADVARTHLDYVYTGNC